MRIQSSYTRKRKARAIIFAAAVSAIALPLSHRALAGTDSWIGTSGGNWTDGTQWSNAAPPANGDDAYLTTSFSGSQSITFNYSGPDIAFSSVTLDATSGGTNTIAMSGHSLTVGAQEIIGSSGIGSFNQTGGAQSFNSANLFMGYNPGSTGTYSLSGSAKILPSTSFYNASVSEYVGYSGAGNFNQSGGTNSVNGTFALGYNPGSTGIYTLSSGGMLNLTNSYSAYGRGYVGYQGQGIFVQTGGTNSLASWATLSLGDQHGATGSYTMSGGTLMASYPSSISVGFQGVGTFNQTGGTVAFASAFVHIGIGGGTGTYTLTGGSLRAASEIVGFGTAKFDQFGGQNYTSSLTLNGFRGNTGTYTLGEGANLTCTFSETSGSQGVGNFIQTGGTNSMTFATLYLGHDAGSTGFYTMSGGLINGYGLLEYIGYSGVGIFNQTGGVNSMNIAGEGQSFQLGSNTGSTGTYNLGAGASLLDSGVNEDIGDLGVAYFNQMGGTHSFLGSRAAVLRVGAYYSATGYYTMSNGVLNAQEEFVGNGGVGNFTQSGGTNNAFDVNLGAAVFGTGTFNLSGGGLTTSIEYIGGKGLGNFNQSGGTNSVAQGAPSPWFQNGLFIGYSAGSTGTYSLSGGTLTVGGPTCVAGTTDAPEGLGNLTVSGAGQFTSSGLTIWNKGTVTLAGGTTTLNALQINGGLLDITSSSFTVNYGSGSSPNSSIRSYVSNSYNAGGSLWTGTNGITSSTAAADPAHHSIAFADGADGVVTNLPAGISSAIPGGGTLPAGSLVVTYAFAGDADLDGKVDFADFILLSNHFGTSDINWDHGNFNFDSIVDFSDFIILSNNFGAGTSIGNGFGATAEELAQYNALAERFGISQSQIAAWDATISNLPEPASAGLLASGVVLLLRPRRR